MVVGVASAGVGPLGDSEGVTPNRLPEAEAPAKLLVTELLPDGDGGLLADGNVHTVSAVAEQLVVMPAGQVLQLTQAVAPVVLL